MTVDRLTVGRQGQMNDLNPVTTMQFSIPLDKMTVAEKLRALETIWDNLQRTPEEVPMPAWHDDVLRARQQRVREGTSAFHNWDDAKRRIREQAR